MIDIRTVEMIKPNHDLSFLKEENKKLVNTNKLLLLVITISIISLVIYNQCDKNKIYNTEAN